MKSIITAVIVGVGAAAGTFGASMLKGSPEAPSGHDMADKADDHAGDKHDAGHGEAKPKPKKGKDGHGKESKSDGSTSFFSFSREFVVPLLTDGQVDSLVIINISLEVSPELSSKLFSMEPKLRDNIMTTLVGLSSDDETFRQLTTVRNYENIRSLVLANLRDEISRDIESVLIMDIARQDI